MTWEARSLNVERESPRHKPLRERLFAKFTIGERDQCWLWQATLDGYGYGQIWRNNKKAKAHRLVYEAMRGPILTGLVIDHLCRNRACVNPWHMEPVTIGENVRRGVSGALSRQRCEARTHCGRGHPYTEENTTRFTNNRGYPGRACKACQRLNWRARYDARKAEGAAS